MSRSTLTRLIPALLVASAAPEAGTGAAITAVLPRQVLRGGTPQASVSL